MALFFLAVLLLLTPPTFYTTLLLIDLRKFIANISTDTNRILNNVDLAVLHARTIVTGIGRGVTGTEAIVVKLDNASILLQQLITNVNELINAFRVFSLRHKVSTFRKIKGMFGPCFQKKENQGWILITLGQNLQRLYMTMMSNWIISVLLGIGSATVFYGVHRILRKCETTVENINTSTIILVNTVLCDIHNLIEHDIRPSVQGIKSLVDTDVKSVVRNVDGDFAQIRGLLSKLDKLDVLVQSTNDLVESYNILSLKKNTSRIGKLFKGCVKLKAL